MNILSWFKKENPQEEGPLVKYIKQSLIACPKCGSSLTNHYSNESVYPYIRKYPLEVKIYEDVPEHQDEEGFWRRATRVVSRTIHCHLTAEDILLNHQKGVTGAIHNEA